MVARGLLVYIAVSVVLVLLCVAQTLQYSQQLYRTTALLSQSNAASASLSPHSTAAADAASTTATTAAATTATSTTDATIPWPTKPFSTASSVLSSLPFLLSPSLSSSSFSLSLFVALFVRFRLNVVSVLNLLCSVLSLLTAVTVLAVFSPLSDHEKKACRENLFNFLVFRCVFVAAVVPLELRDLVCWVAFFSCIAAMRVVIIVARERFTTVTVQPTAGADVFVRLIGVMAGVCAVDVLLAAAVWLMLARGGAAVSVVCLMLFEHAVLLLGSVKAGGKYAIHLVGLGRESAWEERNSYLYYCEFVFECLIQLLTILHYVHVWWLYGLSVTIIDLFLFLHLRSSSLVLFDRLSKYVHYRRASVEINNRYADATRAELDAADDFCAICRESMDSAKKLPCLTGDHRVLTRTGWKSITRVKLGDDVLSFNVVRDAPRSQYVMEWKPVTALTSHVVDPNSSADRLYRMSGAAMDVIATRDHNMLLARLHPTTGLLMQQPFEYETVGHLLEESLFRATRNTTHSRLSESVQRSVVCAGLNSQEAVMIVIPGLERVCEWWWRNDKQLRFLQFLGLWLSDGHLAFSTDSVCVAAQKKGLSCKRLSRLLDAVFPRWWHRTVHAGKYKYVVRCPPLYNYLRLMTVGPVGFNPRDKVALRSYPHFTKDEQLAEREQQAAEYINTGQGSTWTEEEMLATMRGDGIEMTDDEDGMGEKESSRRAAGKGMEMADAEEQEEVVGEEEMEAEIPQGEAITADNEEQAVQVASGAAVVWWHSGLWIIINSRWFCLKRWLGDEEQIANVYSRLSREQAIALLDGFCRADGRWSSVKFNSSGEPTGQWRCSSSSFPLIDHLMVIGQLAGAAVHVELSKPADTTRTIGDRTVTFQVDHWRLFFTFTQSKQRDTPSCLRLAPLDQPVDVSGSIDGRGYYAYKDDAGNELWDDRRVYCITVADNSNFLTQRLSVHRQQSNQSDNAVRGYSVFIGNCGHLFHRTCITQWMEYKGICPSCRAPLLHTAVARGSAAVQGRQQQAAQQQRIAAMYPAQAAARLAAITVPEEPPPPPHPPLDPAAAASSSSSHSSASPANDDNLEATLALIRQLQAQDAAQLGGLDFGMLNLANGLAGRAAAVQPHNRPPPPVAAAVGAADDRQRGAARPVGVIGRSLFRISSSSIASWLPSFTFELVRGAGQEPLNARNIAPPVPQQQQPIRHIPAQPAAPPASADTVAATQPTSPEPTAASSLSSTSLSSHVAQSEERDDGKQQSAPPSPLSSPTSPLVERKDDELSPPLSPLLSNSHSPVSSSPSSSAHSTLHHRSTAASERSRRELMFEAFQRRQPAITSSSHSPNAATATATASSPPHFDDSAVLDDAECCDDEKLDSSFDDINQRAADGSAESEWSDEDELVRTISRAIDSKQRDVSS